MISKSTKLDSRCNSFVVCESIVSCLQVVWVQMNIIYSLMEVIILHEAEGVNKSLHLESAMFAHSVEQNDLIHAARWNCLLGKRPKESGNNTELEWHSLKWKHWEKSTNIRLSLSCLSLHFLSQVTKPHHLLKSTVSCNSSLGSW